MPWQITAGPERINPRGRDATAWAWTLVGEVGRDHRLLAYASRTMMATSDDHLPLRVIDFRETSSRSEVEAILDWEQPPFELDADTRGVRHVGGRPGPWSRQLVELSEWFEGRGVLMYFISPPLPMERIDAPYMETYVAHLLDEQQNRTLGIFDGLSRVEAAEKARDWWLDNFDDPAVPKRETAWPSGTKAAQTQHRLRTEGRHIVWTKEDDPNKKVWMVQVFDDGGNLVGMGLGDDKEDAILDLAEHLYPDWD